MEFYNPLFAGTSSLAYMQTQNYTLPTGDDGRVRVEWFPSFISTMALPETNQVSGLTKSDAALVACI